MAADGRVMVPWQDKHWELGPKLGEGVYGKVYRLMDEGQPVDYVVKFLKGGGSYQNLEREVTLHGLLRRAQIPTVEISWDPRHRFMVKGLAGGETLDHFMDHEKVRTDRSGQEERQRKKALLQEFMQKLVDSKVYFGDLSGENILFDLTKGWVVVDARLPKIKQGEYLTSKKDSLKAYRTFFTFIFPDSKMMKDIFKSLSKKGDAYGINMDVEGMQREFQLNEYCASKDSYLWDQDLSTEEMRIFKVLGLVK